MKKLSISIDTILLFIMAFAGCVRCYSERFFGSVLLECGILLVTFGVFVIRRSKALKKVKKIEILWLIITLITILNYNSSYYSNGLHILSIVSILCFFMAEKGGRSVYPLLFLWIIFATLNACITWIQLIDFSVYQKYFAWIITSDASTNILTIYKQSGGLSGLTDHYSRNATYIVIGICAAIPFIFFNSKQKYKRLSLIMGVFLLCSLLIVGKRGHLIFLAVALIIAYVVYQPNVIKKFWRIIGSFFIVLVVFLLAMKFIPSFQNMMMRFIVNTYTSSDVTSGRVSDIYPMAWKLFLQHPLFGFGYGGFSVSCNAFYAGVHNDYLQWLCEYGIVGFAFMIVVTIHSYSVIYKLFCGLAGKKINLGYKNNILIVWSFIFQTWILLYSFTGIPHYDYEAAIVYYFACGVGYYLKNIRTEEMISEKTRNSNTI